MFRAAGGFQRQLGERAWKQWSRRRNLDQGKTACSKKLCRLSSMNIEEMNSNLVEFVRDIRKPNGDKYRPDVLLYFLYGAKHFPCSRKAILAGEVSILTEAFHSLNRITVRSRHR